MASRTRITIAQGIYQDAHGITVIARIGSRPHIHTATARFPLADDDGVPFSKRNSGELLKCRVRLQDDLKRQYGTSRHARGALGVAIDAYLVDQVEARLAYLYRAWQAVPLAAIPVTAVGRRDIRAQLETWAKAGMSPTSINDRKRALADVLRHALEVDDDDDTVIATDKIANVPARTHAPRGVPLPIIARILASLPDRGRPENGTRGTVSQSKIRLTVMAWTGLPNISLKRLQRRQVNFREAKIFLPARKKGRGAVGVWVDILPSAVAALRAYDDANLWGQFFSNSSLYRTWRRAITRTRLALVEAAEASGDRTMLDQFLETVPENCHPYDLRHSYLTDAYRQSGDIRAVQAIAQHADIKTTEQYTKAAVPERVASAIDKMRARWFPEAPKPGVTVRDFHVVEKA